MSSRLFLSRSLLRSSAPLQLRPPPSSHLFRLRPRFITTAPPQPAPPTTLSARLKSLSKEYGYSALGVYFALSALDFPFCFLAVRAVGTEKIGQYEERIVGFFKPYYAAARARLGLPKLEDPVKEELVEAEDKGKAASIWTELALAYAIHKSFIFIRVPLTAAVTPKVVKVLRGWGWDIGRKGKPKIGTLGKGKGKKTKKVEAE